MVRGDGVNNFVWHTILLCELSANVSVFAFNFMSNCFADIMHEGCSLCDTFIGPNLFGDHTSHVCHLNGVKQNVLAIARTEF